MESTTSPLPSTDKRPGWRRRPSPLNNLLDLLALLPRVHPWQPWLFAFGIVVSAILPIATAVITGLLVGSIPAAVADGFDSAAGQYTLNLLAAVAGLVVAMRVNGPLQSALAVTLGRRLDRYLQERVMAAVGRPAGIAHLEEADTLDRLRLVRELGVNQNRPSLAVSALASVLPAWIQALGSAAVLLWFHWQLGLLWLMMWPVVVYYMQREYLKVGQIGYGQSGALRRAAPVGISARSRFCGIGGQRDTDLGNAGLAARTV
jgi:ATP-binding cassette, subfamily B, bacterial